MPSTTSSSTCEVERASRGKAMKRFLATVCATLWVLPSALYAQGLGASQLILTNSSGGGVILQPNPAATSLQPLTLPADLTAGTLVSGGRILQSDGDGNLSWLDPAELAAATAWALTGNIGTDPTVNFLGTRDAQPLVIRTNNMERLRVTEAGHVLPGLNNEYDLGSDLLRWRNVYGVDGDFSRLRVSTLTVSGLTPGSVIFAGAGGALSQNNAKFFWDNGNERLGIGTNAPAATLDVVGTAQVSGNTSVGGNLSVGGDGSVTGNLTVAGNTTLGDNAAVDLVTLNARVQSHVVPSVDNTYDLGENTTPLRWRSGYFGTQVKVGASVSLVAATNALEYTGGDGRISVVGASALRVSTNGLERLIVSASGHVLPGANNEYDLGASDARWANIYGVNGSLSGNLTVVGSLNVGSGSLLQGNTVIGGAATDEVHFVGRVATDVLPKTNNAYNLGSSSLRWANVYGVNGDFSTVRVSGLTPGSVIFAGAGGALSQNNAKFFWDNGNERLGIGTNAPAATLDVVGTAQVSGNTSVGGNLSVGGDGSVTGNLTVAGNTTLGDNAAVDLVTLNARVQSHVVPSVDNTYDLGENTTPLRWRSGYFGTQVKVGASVSLVAATNALEYTGGDGRISVVGASALRVSTNGLERLIVSASGHVLPGANNEYDLGASDARWANIYGVNGSLSGNLTVVGSLNVGSGSMLQGNTVIGGAATDEVHFVGRVATDVLPKTNNAYNLGSSSLRWANVYGVNGDFSTVRVSGLTPGSVIFAGAGGALSQNNAKFFWDNGNERLGIGTNAPAATLDVVGTAQVSGNTSVGGNLSVGGDGSVTGNLTVAGNTTLGDDAAVDLVTLNARVQSHVVPSVDNTYDLGENTTPLRWRSGYFGTQVKVGASVSLVAATNALEYTGGDGRISVVGASALRVSTNGLERLIVSASGHVLPGANNEYDLGASDARWANIYGVNGSLSGNLTVVGSLNVGSGSMLQGNTVIGGAATDEVHFVGRVATDVLPKTNNAYNLGSSSLRWANVYGVNGDFSTVRVSGLTPGSVIFAGAGGALSQNNAKFFWDNGNERLGIGTNAPAATLDVVGTAQVSGNTSVGGNLSVGGDGSVTGNLTVAGNTTLGDDAAVDLVTLNARVQSHVVPSVDNTYDLGENTTPLRWRSGYFGTQVKVGASVSLVAATNALEYTGGDGRISVVGASALRVSTNGLERLIVSASGHVLPGANNEYDLGASDARWANIYGVNGSLSGNLTVVGSLNVGSGSMLQGNTVIGGAATDEVHFVGRVATDVLPKTNNAYNLGSSSLRWANVYGVNGDFSTVRVSGLTPGSVIFAGAGGALSQNNAKFFWDNGNERLGIGTNAPAATLDVVGTAQVSGNTSVGGNLSVGGDGSVTGNLTVAGDTTLGDDAAVDLVTLNARVQSDVVPSADDAYDLGSAPPAVAQWVLWDAGEGRGERELGGGDECVGVHGRGWAHQCCGGVCAAGEHEWVGAADCQRQRACAAGGE
jgi:predicted acyltransferase (DUF342 family)